MKKMLLITLCLLILCGCNKKELTNVGPIRYNSANIAKDIV